MNDVIILSNISFNSQFDSALPLWEKQKVFPYAQALAKKITNNENIPANANAKKVNVHANKVAEFKQKKNAVKIDKEKKNKQAEVKSSAYKLYKNACEGGLPFMVIGGEDLRDTSELLLNFGALAKEVPLCHKLNLPEHKKGSILCDTNWNIVENDAYMLGSIHAKKTFYVYSKTPKDLNKILWDEENNRPRIAGREIAILYAAGYRQVANDQARQLFGATFVCLDHNKAENFTLKEIVEATANKTSCAALNKMFTYFPEN